MSKLKVKVALKDAQQFAKRFWGSAVAKMTGKPKSKGVTAAPAQLQTSPHQDASDDDSSDDNSDSSFAANQSQADSSDYGRTPTFLPTSSASSQAPSTAPPQTDDNQYLHFESAPRQQAPGNPSSSNPPTAPPQNTGDYITYDQAQNPQSADNASSQSPPNPPPQAPAQPTASQAVDPNIAEFQRLSKQVEDDIFKLARTLPEKTAIVWRERLVAAGNKARENPPDYVAAVQELKTIQQDLSDQRGPLERAAFDELSARFTKTFLAEAALAGEKAEPLRKAFIKTATEVDAKTLPADKAIPVVAKLDRDLHALLDKRKQAIAGVIADYGRILPVLIRAEALLAEPVPAQTDLKDKVKTALNGLDNFCKRVPLIKQFFPKTSPLSGQKPDPPRVAAVKEAMSQYCQEPLKNADLDELKKRLAELESVAIDALKNMDVTAQLEQQADRLPVDASKLQLSNKKLGSGNFADTYVVNGPGVKPMAAKVLKSTDAAALQELDKEAEVYARLGEHPNIAKCYGKQDLPGGKTALVMEMVEGKNSSEMFNDLANQHNAGKISREEYMGTMQHMIHGILMGLAQFEALGMSHRDIKGDNIRFDPVTNEPKILDMGLAQEHGQVHGNVPVKWSPPEVMTTGQVGVNFDTFGLGQTVHQQLERWGKGDNEEAPWKVSPLSSDVGDGNFFVPGEGTRHTRAVKNQNFIDGASQAVDAQGQPTPMPLTKASDQKTDGEVKGATAPGAQPGKYGAETAYVDFMNKLLHPDPAQRMSPSEALRHPFMTDRLLSKEQVGALLSPDKKAPPKENMAPPPRPRSTSAQQAPPTAAPQAPPTSAQQASATSAQQDADRDDDDSDSQAQSDDKTENAYGKSKLP